VAAGKRLLVLTRDRAGASFRHRIEPYLEPLAGQGIASEVMELARSPLVRRGQWRQAREFGGVLMHRKTLTTWDAWALESVGARRLIYDFDDAVMYQASAPAEPHPARLRRFQRTMARADLVMTGSPLLAEWAQREGARHVAVVPTGLDVRRFRPKTDYDSGGPLRLVWLGSGAAVKHLEEFRPMFEAVGRAVPGAVLRVIAEAKLSVAGLAVENLPWDPQTEARLLAESDIGLSPLPDTPYACGKGGFRVLQYMAAGLPVVASPVGTAADYVVRGVTGLHARTSREWVAAIKRLAGDAALRERLGRAGRMRICGEYDFSALIPKVTNLLGEVMA